MSDEIIRVSYQLSEPEFVEGQQIHARSRRMLHWLSRAVFVVVVICTGVVVATNSTPGLLGQAVPMVVLVALWAVFLFWFPTYLARRQFRGDPRFHVVTTLEASPEGIRLQNEVATNTFTWKGCSGYRESERIFLLYLSNVMFVPLPKRAFPEPDLARLRELVRRNAHMG